MLTKRIIPCLDCKDGKVYKGIAFKNLKEIDEPENLAVKYQAQGADEIVLLDISATIEGRKNQVQTIKSVRKKLNIPLTVGGGIGDVTQIKELLNAGADKVAINSSAVKNPDLINQSVKSFGSQCIVVSIDAETAGSNCWNVVTRSGTYRNTLDVLEWSKECEKRGAGEILLTSINQDGTQTGYDLDLIKTVSLAINIPIIASGGARNVQDLILAFQSGADAVLAASMFHYDEMTIKECKEVLKNKNIEVRI